MAIFSEPITAAAGVAVLLAGLPRQRTTTTWRLTFVVLLLTVWAFVTPMRTVKYFLVLTTLLWIIESRINRQPLWLWGVVGVVISPLFQYITDVFSFPIRLQISRCAGWILTHAGYPVQITGNTLTLNGEDFSVDPACVGLHLVGFSYLAAVFLLSQSAQKHRRSLAAGWIAVLMVLVLGLNIFANLVRIVALVATGWPPTHPMHEITGLICIVVYVWLPIGIIVRALSRYRLSAQSLIGSTEKPFTISILVNKRHISFSEKRNLLTCFVALLVACVCLSKTNFVYDEYPQTLPPVGYKQVLLPAGIKQLKNTNSLIYLKNIPTFYSVEHSPYTCWRGSGYELKDICEVTVSKTQMYKARMIKGHEQLYTVWWFSNGRQHTNSQLDFRWQMLCYEDHFHLVNVTVSQEKDLEQVIQKMLDTEVSSIGNL